MWLRDLLLLGSTASICVVSLFNPVFGILAYFAYSFFSPHAYVYEAARNFPHAQSIAIATLVGYVFWKEPKRFPKDTILLLLLCLYGYFCMSTVFSIFPDRATTSLGHISKILLMIVVALSIINTKERFLWLVRVFSFSIGAYGIKGGLFVLINGANHMITGPYGSFLTANTAFGLALAMNIPLLIFLIRIESFTWLRWIEKAALVLAYPAIIGTFSRGAWLGLALVTLLILLKSQYKILAFSFGVIFLIVAPLWLPFILTDAVVNRFDQLVNYEEESSAVSRFWSWEFCARVGISNPITGGGFQYYSTEMYAKYFPEFRDRWGYERVWSCHSMWLTILGEHGIGGFFLWLGLLGSSFLSLWNLRSKKNRSVEGEWVRYFSDMTAISLLGYLLMGTFLDVAYYEGFYLTIGLIIMAKNITKYSLIDDSKSHTSRHAFSRQAISSSV